MTLPGCDVEWVKAKLDTGARSSSIHAFDVVEFERDGSDWVRFSIHPWQRSESDAAVVERPVHDRRSVRSSSGHAEERFIVLLDVGLVGRTVTAEVSLTDRDEMGFRMLVGREALRQGFLVDSGRSYLGERPPLAVRRRNRGR
ncbi:RimK/LysX family protein [Intrasporangium flavum]|uniref:ATP-dependent zinc protease family protein n=1 Tax=Intrasporangium flavum TaxID=1428657 RepID=UPI001F6056A6